MQRTLAEIAKLINGELVGDGKVVITGFSGIKEAKPGDLTFVANAKYFPWVEKTRASAIIAPFDLKIEGRPVILAENPSVAFQKVLSTAFDRLFYKVNGIHPSVIRADDVALGKDVNIGPFTIIEKGVRIGENTTIGSHCYFGTNTTIGESCLFYPNITVRENITIGNRVIIHSGTVIGSDGFGFVNVDGIHQKIPQVGTVVIEDDVEIGANVTIDRARFDKTVIGAGTKIDNLVQIAHNVKIGKNCIIVSQVGISGSCTIEDNVILAGQVGLAGHLTIGQGAIVAAKSGVPDSVPPHTVVWGIPAKPQAQARRVNASLQRLPHYVRIILDLKKRIEGLEKRLEGKQKK